MKIIIGPAYHQLLSPERVARMAKEMEREYAKQIAARATRAEAQPKELQDLSVRLTRLRTRLTLGDPDMAADEIQAAIDKCEAKRQVLLAAQPAARASAKVLSILPKAAEA